MPFIRNVKVHKAPVESEEDDLESEDLGEEDEVSTRCKGNSVETGNRVEAFTFTKVLPNEVSEDGPRPHPPDHTRSCPVSVVSPKESTPVFDVEFQHARSSGALRKHLAVSDEGQRKSSKPRYTSSLSSIETSPSTTPSTAPSFVGNSPSLLSSDVAPFQGRGSAHSSARERERKPRFKSFVIGSSTKILDRKKERRRSSAGTAMVEGMKQRLTVARTLKFTDDARRQALLTPHQALEMLADINDEFKDDGDVVFSNNINVEYHDFNKEGEHSSYHHESCKSANLEALLRQTFQENPEKDKPMERCRWLHVPGVNPQTLHDLQDFFSLDPTSTTKAEHRHSHPCVEGFPHYLFIVAHQLQKNPNEESCSAFCQQQVTMFFLPRWDLLITIQEDDVDPWSGIRVQLENENSLLRKSCQTTLLIYMLLDALIDGVHPILEDYGEYLSGLDRLITRQAPQHDHVALSYEIKRHIWEIRRFSWRTRNMIDDLQQDPWDAFPNSTKRLLNSIRRSAHCIAEVASAYLESAQAIETYYESYQTNQMNQTLYTLSILTVIIIPTQFLTGVFGMNFEYMPELTWKYSYLFFWLVVAIIMISTLVVLWRRGMLSRQIGVLIPNDGT